MESTATGTAATQQESFFDRLGDDERRALESLGNRRRYQRGTALFHERQNSDKVVVLLDGRVKITSLSEDGHETVLAIRGPGDVLGELSAIDEQPRSATATTLEPVDALVVAASDFRRFLDSTPRVGRVLLEILAERVRDSDRKRVEFGALDTVGRVAAALFELAETYGEAGDEGVVIDLPLSQEELAGLTAASREAVAKALKTLRDCGWVKTERRRITVLDQEALRRRAG